MNATQLKRKLKSSVNVPEELAIRLHRSISWLKCAEQQSGDPDVMFITQWIAFNACYAIELNGQSQKTEREKFRTFIANLVDHDAENRIFNILWQKFSGPVMMLIENEYVFRGFWDYQRGDVSEWEKSFKRSNEDAFKYLSANNVAGLLEILLDRLYILRNQLMHGGATYKSKLNRRSVKDGCRILEMLIPIIIEIIMENPEEDWGRLLFPVVIN
ncbi:MAG: hypothetical protein ACK5AO_04440 [bacterium]